MKKIILISIFATIFLNCFSQSMTSGQAISAGSHQRMLTTADWTNFCNSYWNFNTNGSPASVATNSLTNITFISPLVMNQAGSPSYSYTATCPTCLTGSLTVGSVFFSGGGQTVTQNNSKFFWDNTYYRLGLGTNNFSQTASDVYNLHPATQYYNYLFRKDSSGRIVYGMMNADTSAYEEFQWLLGSQYRAQSVQIRQVGRNNTHSNVPKGTITMSTGSGASRLMFYNDGSGNPDSTNYPGDIEFGNNPTELSTGLTGLTINGRLHHLNYVGVGTGNATVPFQAGLRTTGVYPKNTKADFLTGPGDGWVVIGGQGNGSRAIKIGQSAAGYSEIQAFRRNDTLVKDLSLQPEGGYVGVGTLTPSAELDVVGQIYSELYGYKFPDNTVQTTAAYPGVMQSGTYTPTFSNTVNTTTVTCVGSFKWNRVVNMVTVVGILAVTETTTLLRTDIDISLPVTSNFTTGGITAAAGTGTYGTGGTLYVPCIIYSNSANPGSATVDWSAGSSSGSNNVIVNFSYYVY